MSNEPEIIRDVIGRQFARYLRTCRSGGMPTELSEQVESAFEVFSEHYLASSIAEGLRAAREANEPRQAASEGFAADGICIQCSAGPDEGCKRDHREPTCWMEERADGSEDER